ncbi:MAG TPA: hypothetical protein VFN68_01825 [Acidimicrobiales bacterium]|nr:hypothetical protein [Acidimicrobiales bacterium]
MTERELVFCASSSRCSTARLVEKGTVFYCKAHWSESQAEPGSIRPGDAVLAKDRRNRGVVLSVEGAQATVRFDPTERSAAAEVVMSTAWLEKA